MAKHLYGGRLLISEHGIYTREREEELIMAKWVRGIYKNIWIEQFYKMSGLAYDRADMVTSLYEHARELQIELGCPVEKTKIVPNGVRVEEFQNLPGRTKEDEGKINIGAVLRITPVKDVMTLLQAFGFAKEREPALKLWVMGSWEEDSEYAQECFELVNIMDVPDVEFTGNVDVKEYYGRMDMIVLTSISEGQPLVILESFSAHKPVIATNVGNCRGLILGEHDDFGAAGISTRIMNVEETAHAMIALARNEPLRVQMGENGYQRVMSRFQMTQLQDTYETIYKDFADSMQIAWETGKGSADTGRKAAEETCKHTAEIEEEPDKESGRS
jgi:Glycosyltransferase